MTDGTDKSRFDFLAPGPAQIRHQIKGILDSYSHEWDLLAELCQNAVDAIRIRQDANSEKGHIKIQIDASKREIFIADNGVGIRREQLPLLLRPFATNKMGNPKQVGSKGVGIAFVIFSSSSFEITTNFGDGGSGRQYPTLLIGLRRTIKIVRQGARNNCR